MRRCTTDTCSLTLPLKVEKWQADRLNKRFELGRQLYNTLLKKKLNEYNKLKQTQEYQELCETLDAFYRADQKQTPEYRESSKKRTALLKAMGFTEYGFITAMRPLYKQYCKNIDSNMAPVIAKDVWKAFEKFLFGNGKKLQYKKYGAVNVLSGQRSRSSIRFYGDQVWFNGLWLTVKRDPQNQYEQEMLLKRIKFCRIKRQYIKGRYKYYVQLVLEGMPALKRDISTGKIKNPLGIGKVGLYAGTRYLAYVSDEGSGIKKLTDLSSFQEAKRNVTRKMNRSITAKSPEASCCDGVFLRKGKFKKSHRYQKLQNCYRELCRKETAARNIQHNLLANQALALGDEFFSAQIHYSFQARKPDSILRLHEERIGAGKYIGENAPAIFLKRLERKIKARGGKGIREINLQAVALPENLQGVQHDLFAAFLLQRYGENIDSYDPHSLAKEYDVFITA